MYAKDATAMNGTMLCKRSESDGISENGLPMSHEIMAAHGATSIEVCRHEIDAISMTPLIALPLRASETTAIIYV